MDGLWNNLINMLLQLNFFFTFCYYSFLNPPKNSHLATKVASIIYLLEPLNLNINN